MKELIMPYVSDLLSIILQIAALAIVYGLVALKKKAEELIHTRLTAQQAQMIELLGREAFSFAETVYRELGGPDKLSHALDYFEQQARARGIPFDADVARAAIERAWLEVGKKSA